MDEQGQINHNIDETDIEILKQVEQDSDINLKQLSDELNLSKSAIHYRLNKLKDDDTITSVSADVNPLAFGLNMLMITEVSVSHERGYADEIGEALTTIEGVYQVYYTMGDVDFIVISRLQTRDQMNQLVDDIVAIDGVNETSSRFVMKELKTDNQTIANMSESMIETVIDG